MKVEIDLGPAEQGVVIELANAAGMDVDTYLQQVVRSQLAERSLAESADDAEPPTHLAADEWTFRLHQWSDRHSRLTHHVDVSRDSIY